MVVVEDDKPIMRALLAVLNNAGYVLRSAETIHDGLQMILDETPSLLVLDIHLPDGTGWNLIEMYGLRRPEGPRPKILAISSERISRSLLRQHGVERFLAKPFDMRYFEESVREMVGG